MKGILAQKIGMTQVISPETGAVTPVTILLVPEAEVLQVKTDAKDGYDAVVLGSFPRKNFGKNHNKAFKLIKEFSVGEEAVKKGQKIGLGGMVEGAEIKVTGTSKGRGFTGVIKRHKFSRGPETHGSHHHREPGSSGMCAKPGRILKGKKMPGHHGDAQVTFRTIIMNVDTTQNILAVRGAVPGAKKSFVTVVTK